MDILSKFGIDPYEYLGVDITSTSLEVKKAYKNKARYLHPDKTGGKTEAQFKLLVLSYKNVIKNCVDKPVSTFEQMKNAPDIEIKPSRNFYNTNFDDQSVRNEIFADDSINLEEFEKAMKKSQSGPTTYAAENYYTKEVIETISTNGKFDKEKFNAFFVKLQKDGKIPNQLVKKEKILAYNAGKQYVNVNVYNDMMINSIDKSSNLIKQAEIKSEDITALKNTSPKELAKIIQDNKKDVGKISRKKLALLQEKANISFKDTKVKNDVSFDAGKESMISEQIKNIYDSKKKQEEYVLKNKRIFVNSITY